MGKNSVAIKYKVCGYEITFFWYFYILRYHFINEWSDNNVDTQLQLLSNNNDVNITVALCEENHGLILWNRIINDLLE